LKPNFIGLISAILAFVTIILPWYSVSVYVITVNFSLWDFASMGLGGLLGTAAVQAWFIWVALALVIVGGLLGLIGGFSIGKKGKTLLTLAGILLLLSPIIFAVGVVASGLPLFGSMGADQYGASVYVSFGFFLAFIAAILMFISLRKHPMEAEAVPFAPVAPTPPPPPQ